MDWYEWNAIEDFNSWHDALCLELGYPLNSYNQATGEIAEESAKTSKYTNPILIEGKVIAVVELQYSDGLTVTSLRIPEKVSV